MLTATTGRPSIHPKRAISTFADVLSSRTEVRRVSSASIQNSRPSYALWQISAETKQYLWNSVRDFVIGKYKKAYSRGEARTRRN